MAFSQLMEKADVSRQKLTAKFPTAFAGSNWLPELAARIRSEHEAVGRSARNALDHASACGQMLIEAKDQLEHGEWLPWLKAHCEIPPRTASHYMRLAKRLPKSASVADLSVTVRHQHS